MSTVSKLPISCYIRTLNEERNIERCLAAIATLVDEVIIVDSGSSDNTLAIASRHGAKVVHQPWLGWGKQKRVGEEASRNPWLLDLDADEVVSEDLADSIRTLFRDTTPSETTVFSLALTTVSPGGRVFRHSGISWRRKLYNKRVVRMPDHDAWDQFQLDKAITERRMQGSLFHHAYNSFESLLHKQNRMSSASVLGKPAQIRPWNFVRLFLGFPFYFLRYYLVRRWILAGLDGFCISMIGAMGSSLRDIKRYESATTRCAR